MSMEINAINCRLAEEVAGLGGRMKRLPRETRMKRLPRDFTLI